MSVWDVQPSESKEYELPPAGSLPAALVGLIDLGTQTEKYGNNEPQRVPSVFLVWELLDEKSESGNIFYLGRKYRRSINEKSNLGQLIGNWRGKPLAKDEGFDLRKLIGKACLLNVVHETSSKDKDYAKVTGASALPKGMKPGKPTTTPLVWSFEDNKPFPTADWIPWVHGQKLIDVLKQSEEARGTGPAPSTNGNTEEQTAGAEADEIPF